MDTSAIRFVQPLPGGGGGGSVWVVEIGDRLWVLKNDSPRKLVAERLFHRTLLEHDLPALQVTSHRDIGPGSLLLEYVPGSPTPGAALTPEVCEQWGAAIGALHRIRYSGFALMNDEGEVAAADWGDFVRLAIRHVVERQRDSNSDLPGSLLRDAERQLLRLADHAPSDFVLTHGDLHLNNALVRPTGVVLFDKAAEVWAGPRLFDLSLIYSEAFPGVRYMVGRADDRARLAAFLKGYGDIPSDLEKWLEHFVLLRSLRRYPSPFVPELRSVIEIAFDRSRQFSE